MRTRKLVSIAVCIVMLLQVITMGSSVSADATYNLSGTAFVQDTGTTVGTFDGTVLKFGTRGSSLRMEQLTVSLVNNTGFAGTIQYRVHIQNEGWTNWTESGNSVGNAGSGERIEAVQMQLTGDLAVYYDVSYQAHIQNYGDSQGWVSNGCIAGTIGESLRVEELMIKLAPKNVPSVSPYVSYHVHRQDYGWENNWLSNGEVSGTTGQSKRLESIVITAGATGIKGGATYRTHVQDIGWTDWSSDGTLSGTQGQGKRLKLLR